MGVKENDFFQAADAIGSSKWRTHAGRARWKIENEGFNTLKNQGYHLEHNFGHGDKYLSETFFVLNLLAFFMHQIFELVDGLYQQVRAGFGSRREFWGAIRATFRLCPVPVVGPRVGADELAAAAAARVALNVTTTGSQPCNTHCAYSR